MARTGKKFAAAKAKVDEKLYRLEEAIPLVQSIKFAAFDESVELAMRLGVNPKHADQMVRGTVVLPHGLGRTKRVVVIASLEKQKEAEESGADTVGAEELVEKIQQGWMDFDAIVATPDMMRSVGKLGRILGPRGLMPNPKTGTVTFDVKQAIEQIQAGKVDYRVDKSGIVHASLGKASFSVEDLAENYQTLIAILVKAKPASSKGHYVRGISVSTTMGVGVRVAYTA